MNLGQLFFWPFLASLIAAIVAGMVFAATKTISRRIVRWTTSRSPKSLDVDRVKEELDAMLNEMEAAERAELAFSLLVNSSALRQELAERAAASLPPDNVATSVRTVETMRLKINKVIEIVRTLRARLLDARAGVAQIENALEQRGWPAGIKINTHNATSTKHRLAQFAENHSQLLSQIADTNLLIADLTRQQPFLIKVILRVIFPELRKLVGESVELSYLSTQEAETNRKIRYILQTFRDYPD